MNGGRRRKCNVISSAGRVSQFVRPWWCHHCSITWPRWRHGRQRRWLDTQPQWRHFRSWRHRTSSSSAWRNLSALTHVLFYPLNMCVTFHTTFRWSFGLLLFYFIHFNCISNCLVSCDNLASDYNFYVYYIQLYLRHNMVAQANKTSKNTTNEIEKNDNSSTFPYCI